MGELNQFGRIIFEFLAQTDLAGFQKHQFFSTNMDRFPLISKDKGPIGTLVNQGELAMPVLDPGVQTRGQLLIHNQVTVGVSPQKDNLTLLMQPDFLIAVAKEKHT